MTTLESPSFGSYSGIPKKKKKAATGKASAPGQMKKLTGVKKTAKPFITTPEPTIKKGPGGGGSATPLNKKHKAKPKFKPYAGVKK